MFYVEYSLWNISKLIISLNSIRYIVKIDYDIEWSNRITTLTLNKYDKLVAKLEFSNDKYCIEKIATLKE